MKRNLCIISFLICSLILFENLNAQNASSYNKSGIQKYINGDFQGAIQDYNIAIEMSSTTAETNQIRKFDLMIVCGQAYVNRGNAKSRLKDYRGAILDYTKAIELNAIEKHQHVYYNRGIAKGNLKDYQEAIKDFSKAIELTPNFADAYYLRGNIKAQSGNMDSACLDWSKAGELGYSEAYDRIKENCNK